MDAAEQFDLVSVGSGAGGLSAAVTAANEGAKVLVLEKAELLGGVTARSGGHVWVGDNHVAAARGIEDSAAAAADYLSSLAGRSVDAVRRDGYIEGARQTLRYLIERIGLAIDLIPDWPDSLYPQAPGSKAAGRTFIVDAFELAELGQMRDRVVVSPHGFAYVSYPELAAAEGDFETIVATATAHAEAGEVVGGSALAARLVKAAAERGVELRTGCRVRRLLGDGDGVTGIEVESAGEVTRIGAAAVVLATGGYDWNRELVRRHEGLEGVRSMTGPAIEGDHLEMAAALGAATASAPREGTPILVGFATPGEELDGGPAYRAVFPTPGAIIVNRAGRRFADESSYIEVNAALRRDPEANWPAWYVFDERYRSRYAVGNVAPGQELPEGLATTSSTPAELGERAGIDAAGLEESIERFNRFAASGGDEEFGRGSLSSPLKIQGDARTAPNRLLGPLDEPPYYAVPLTQVGLGIPTAGLKIDTSGRVLGPGDAPIPGLYAAGNAAARLDVGGYQDGVGNGRGLVYGHLAALDARSRS